MVHWASYYSDELVVVNSSFSCSVKSLEHCQCVFMRNIESVLSHRFSKLEFVQTLGSVVVHDFEESLKTEHSICASLFYFSSKQVQQIRHRSTSLPHLPGVILSEGASSGGVGSEGT